MTAASGSGTTTSPKVWAPSILFFAIWVAAYANLEAIAGMIFGWLPLERAAPFGGAVYFFLYEVPKVLLLLVLVVYAISILRTFFSPERTRALLAGRSAGVGNGIAACLGIVTPFCSCSAVPLFIGFLSAGVPLGVTLSFLISAPMVNEIALALLFGLFGWKIATLYLVLGLAIAICSGLVIGMLSLDAWEEPWVLTLPGTGSGAPDRALPSRERLEAGRLGVYEVVGRVWPYIVIGIAIGAAIHGYVPEDFMAGLMGRDAWWSVPAAVLIGVPMYSNAAGIIPVVEALLAKGAALGTVLAFMMSVIALSLPELVILRKVLRPQLLAVFVGVVATGILIVGYVFNIVL